MPKQFTVFFVIALFALLVQVAAGLAEPELKVTVTHLARAEADWIWTITLDRPAPRELAILCTLRTKKENGDLETVVKIPQGKQSVNFTLPEYNRVIRAEIVKETPHNGK